MMAPEISVILTTYCNDNLNHLVLSTRSILNQSFKNFEFIIVVDGPVSPEASSYLRELALCSNTILIWLELNSGASHARNIGIVRAQGKYIAIMDADDVSHPDRLRLQLEFIKVTGAHVISSWLQIIDDKGILVGVRRLPLSREKIVLLSFFRCPMHNPSVFGEADVLKSHLYDEGLSVSEDYDLWVRMLADRFILLNMSDNLVQYRQDPQSIKKRVGLKYFIADLIVKFKTLKYAKPILFPLLLLSFILSSLPRLLPLFIFRQIYKFKSSFF